LGKEGRAAKVEVKVSGGLRRKKKKKKKWNTNTFTRAFFLMPGPSNALNIPENEGN
jgi:hypothetical protein